MTRVVRREGESFESLLRRLRRRMPDAHILSTARRQRRFVSKSEQRRSARRQAIRRERLRNRHQRRMHGTA